MPEPGWGAVGSLARPPGRPTLLGPTAASAPALPHPRLPPRLPALVDGLRATFLVCWACAARRLART